MEVSLHVPTVSECWSSETPGKTSTIKRLGDTFRLERPPSRSGAWKVVGHLIRRALIAVSTGDNHWKDEKQESNCKKDRMKNR